MFKKQSLGDSNEVSSLQVSCHRSSGTDVERPATYDWLFPLRCFMQIKKDHRGFLVWTIFGLPFEGAEGCVPHPGLPNLQKPG